jgi:LmbE family N-acetylglucosaminyl deacetylase
VQTPIFLSPHDDDHALFGAFTCLRVRPILVIAFDGYVQAARGLPVTADQRKVETERAARLLDCSGVVRLGFRDDDPAVTADNINTAMYGKLNDLLDKSAMSAPLYAPAWTAGGHPQHNLCADAASCGWKVEERYLSYTAFGKSESDRKVAILEGHWIYRKLMALSRYESQFNLDPRMGCWQHFLRSQEEYYA